MTFKDSFSPWLSVKHTGTSSLIEFDRVLSRMDIAPNSYPTLTILVGSESKSRVLQHLINQRDYGFLDSAHGKVFLWPAPLPPPTKSKLQRSYRTPTIFVDYEIHTMDDAQYNQTPPEGIDPMTVHRIDWITTSDRKSAARRRLGDMLCSRALGPFSDTVCYFVNDFGGRKAGIAAIANILATQFVLPPVSDVSFLVQPDIVVVAEIRSGFEFDGGLIKEDLYQKITAAIKTSQKADGVPLETDYRDIYRIDYDRIHVMGINTAEKTKSRSGIKHLSEQLTILRQDSLKKREEEGILFNHEQLSTLMRKMLRHFCDSKECPPPPFKFAQQSRAAGFPSTLRIKSSTIAAERRDDSNALSRHMNEVLAIIPSNRYPLLPWLSNFLCPLVASAISLACYPSGSPSLPMPWLYKQLFESQVLLALEHSNVDAGEQTKFQIKLQRMLIENKRSADTVKLHRNTLRSLREVQTKDGRTARFFDILPHTNLTCLSCLLRQPEKTLQCGHALCDTCVRTFGSPIPNKRHVFRFDNCPLCGVPHFRASFELIPPTAGIRVLTLDGGGIRGIITLGILKRLEEQLMKSLGVPIQSYFDFVCGTSAGGIIAMGLFLKGWSIERCIRSFEELATKTFRSRASGVFELASSYFRDGKYSSSPIEQAFKTSVGNDAKMFNPLTRDTKVAVTTTTTDKKPRPCLITNYNGRTQCQGGIRPYTMLRARRSEHDLTISQAAMCTSAAPWYFKANATMIGTFQDGGLQHNNPINVARWEVKAIWPEKENADLIVSVGTGSCIAKPDDPTRERTILLARAMKHIVQWVWNPAIERLYNNAMESMDGERAHEKFANDLLTPASERYCRLNLFLSHPEPALDDPTQMGYLKEMAFINDRPRIKTFNTILELAFASLFYFELDSLPTWADGVWMCSGRVLCRLHMDFEGRERLYHKLSQDDYRFLLPPHGTPTKCVDKRPKGLPPFQKAVKFWIPSLDELGYGITILAARARPRQDPRSISGFPMKIRQVMAAQELDAPFGRANGSRKEKTLPPTKRTVGKRKRRDSIHIFANVKYDE